MHRAHPTAVLLGHDGVQRDSQTTERWLAHAGYRCFSSAATSAALRLVGHLRADVAVIDVDRLPADGLWLAGHLRALPAPVPVVLIHSANGTTTPTGRRLAALGCIASRRDQEAVLRAVNEAIALETQVPERSC